MKFLEESDRRDKGSVPGIEGADSEGIGRIRGAISRPFVSISTSGQEWNANIFLHLIFYFLYILCPLTGDQGSCRAATGGGFITRDHKSEGDGEKG